MKIEINQNIVELSPENDTETKALEQVWQTIVDCVGDSKKLAPIGEFVPVKENKAKFVIE